MTDAAIADRDEQVAQAISAGRSLRRIQRDFSLSVAELDQALEKHWPVSNDARIRMIKHDLARLERILEMLFEKSVAGDINASAVFVKALDRKAQALGLDCAQRIDLQITQQPAKDDHQRMVDTLTAFFDRLPPAEKALRRRLQEMSAETALELLGPPQVNGDGDGAGDVPLSPDDAEPK